MIKLKEIFTEGKGISKPRIKVDTKKQKLVDKIMNTCYKDDDPKYDYSNYKYLDTLSTSALQDILDNYEGYNNARFESKLMPEAKSPYQVYHKSYSSAVQAAEEYANKKGYTCNEQDWWNNISTGPKKPSNGKTNKATIGLHVTKSMKPNTPPMLAGKALHLQVYGMNNGYELNCYIS